jgi:peptidoglycan/LPS O-acetylase OafA/YrhL
MSYPLLAPAFKYGYLGVELFFMISGFVILMTADRGSLRSFAISRIVRLYPAFWACCTATFLVTLAIGGDRYSASIVQYLVNMTMLSDFVGVPSIDGAYWSLFVEIRFYALVVIILMMGKIRHAQKLIISWLALSVVFELFPIGAFRYILITDYSAYFIAGATYFLIWSRGLSLTRFAILTVSWLLAMFQALSGLHGFGMHFNTFMSKYIVAGVITIFFVLMMLISLRRTGFFGRTRWLLIGSLTYPLYLLHQNIGFMVFNMAYPVVNVHILFWGVIVSLLVSSYAVHYLIESPLSLPLKNSVNSLARIIWRFIMRFSGRANKHTGF